MKFNKIILFFIGSFCILALAGCFLLPQEDEYLQPPLRAPDRIEYTTVEVTIGSIADEVRGNGAVEARSGETVSFGAISGRLKDLHFNAGHDVQEGDLLAELLNDDLLEALERQEIYTRLAEIDFERNRRGSRLDREVAQLRLDLSKLDLKKAQENVEKTFLFAPMSGRITYSTNIKTGEYIEPFKSIFTIVDMTDLCLRISSDFVSKVPLGATVRFTLNNETHYGTVVQVPSLNPADVSDRNVAVIESESLNFDEIRLGAAFTIIYERARVDDAIVIQSSLIRREGTRTYVVLLENGVPVERAVVIGISTTSYTEIIEGLFEGELIIQ